MCARQEGRQGSARRRGQARQRASCASSRQRTSSVDRAGRSDAPRRAAHGKARRLPLGVAAVRAARAADRGHRWSSSSGRRRRRLYSRSSCRTPSAPATEFVGFENFARAVRTTPSYLASFKTTAVFCVAGRGAAASRISLLLAVLADRVMRGALVYKTLLIWPYAVAPAVAGVLWLFMFAPSIGIVTYCAARASASTGTSCSTATRRCADRDRRGLEADLATTSCSSSPACSRSRSR